VNAFAARYAACFVAYVRGPGEETLGAAYELGREAVAQDISLTQVAVAHHDALAGALGGGEGGRAPAETARAAGDFLLEVLAAFDMVQRGFREVRDAAQRERQHAELLRQLSHFMTDESLSSAGSQALDEVLRLVAEQARELTQADTALVTLGPDPQAHAHAACYPDDDTRWDAFARWTDIAPIDAQVRAAGGEPVHLDAGQIATALVSGPSPSSLDLDAWLGVALRSLTGTTLGCLHLLTQASRFSAGDAAVAVHLAEMSAAAVERTDLHAVRGPVG
jgi:hypothetical protein